MEEFWFSYEKAVPFFDRRIFEELLRKGEAICRDLLDETVEPDAKGWIDPQKAAVDLQKISVKAFEIREKADAFVLVGVGGSNQAARAVIKAIDAPHKPEILYAGNTLSAYEVRKLLHQLEGKSVYINVIAKNFETLEPGSHYRVLRNWMKHHYDANEMAKRIVLTGTRGSRLWEIAWEHGHLFLDFPKAIGGRYSAFSPVGLLPMAVAGIDLAQFLQGVQDMHKEIQGACRHAAVEYAAVRQTLYCKGYDIEVLSSFEPRLEYFSKWWVQLFGESEGKGQKGIFPSYCICSEDLHAMGQYLQEGMRRLMETFLVVKDPQASVTVQPDSTYRDGFDYLDGMDFAAINEAAQSATVQAHNAGGVPCMELHVERLDEAGFGRLFYFFMIACAVSSRLSGVNPFDQEGVEAYKRSMFQKLGK